MRVWPEGRVIVRGVAFDVGSGMDERDVGTETTKLSGRVVADPIGMVRGWVMCGPDIAVVGIVIVAFGWPDSETSIGLGGSIGVEYGFGTTCFVVGQGLDAWGSEIAVVLRGGTSKFGGLFVGSTRSDVPETKVSIGFDISVILSVCVTVRRNVTVSSTSVESVVVEITVFVEKYINVS